MTDLHRKMNESAESWLTRLQAIDRSRLPLHVRNALTLSIGYARHLLNRSRRQDEAPAGALAGYGEDAPWR